MKNKFVFVFCAMMLSSCAIMQAQKNKSKIENGSLQEYKEDLQPYRIKYTYNEEKPPMPLKSATMPVNDDTKKIEALLDSMSVYNLNIRTAEGYRVLIYSGTKKADALQAQLNAKEILQEDRVYLIWDSPNFKVKVGDYFSRLEAYTTQTYLLKDFPGSIIVPDKVNINRP
ncbi:MAG: hypothetical protein NZ529_07370 [Cytophagaceae bacterium]|nr:hypothetical protein [Cytophagaceae bacterium]MDW8456603.1 hypothetical protein [Cytophagaceae bacterium]